MAVYDLDIDESVVLHTEGVYTEFGGKIDLILTNKNLIQVNKSFFGKNVNFIKYPLDELKTFKGKANVLINKSYSGRKQLELYFINCEKVFYFDKLFAANKWLDAIIKTHKERLEYIKKDKKSSIERKSIFGSVNNKVGNLFVKIDNVKKTCKCPRCGAELNGNKGEEVVCSYCENVVKIK